jgi:hypothetical protein
MNNGGNSKRLHGLQDWCFEQARRNMSDTRHVELLASDRKYRRVGPRPETNGTGGWTPVMVNGRQAPNTTNRSN